MKGASAMATKAMATKTSTGRGRAKARSRLAPAAFALVCGIALAGCSSPGEAEARGGAAGSGRAPVAVEVAPVAAADLTEAVEVVGSLSPKFETEIKSEYSGIAAEVTVTEWVRVKKGEPLAKLDTREDTLVLQKARAALASAQAGLLQAQVSANRTGREHERLVKLKDAGLATQQSLDDAASAREAAAAGIAAARAMLQAAEEDVRHAETRLAKAVIRAPMDGIIAYRGVNVGDLVGEMGSPKIMFRIVDNRLLNLTVTVASKDLASIAVGQPLTFSTDAIPGKTFTGTVLFVNPAADEADRSVKVVAEVRNEPEELRAGLFAKGRIVTGARAGVLQVPRAALVAWNVARKQADLFAVEGGIARHRTVGTGVASGDLVEVTSGLAAGDRVVTRGGFNVRDGDAVTVVAAAGEKGASANANGS